MICLLSKCGNPPKGKITININASHRFQVNVDIKNKEIGCYLVECYF